MLNRPHSRTGRPLTAGTKQVERSYLQVWGNWATEEGYFSTDPSRRLPAIKLPRRKARPLRLAHILAMLELDGTWQSTLDMITVAANTGLRVGEIVRIDGNDYDRFTNELKSIRKGGVEQYISCTPAMTELASRMPTSGWWFPSHYCNALFPDGGGHILPKSASTRLGAVIRRVGLTDSRLTAHSFRHFFACMLLARGNSLHVVQEMMGHASLATTQLYIEVAESEISRAVNSVPRISSGRAVNSTVPQNLPVFNPQESQMESCTCSTPQAWPPAYH